MAEVTPIGNKRSKLALRVGRPMWGVYQVAMERATVQWARDLLARGQVVRFTREADCPTDMGFMQPDALPQTIPEYEMRWCSLRGGLQVHDPIAGEWVPDWPPETQETE